MFHVNGTNGFFFDASGVITTGALTGYKWVIDFPKNTTPALHLTRAGAYISAPLEDNLW